MTKLTSAQVEYHTQALERAVRETGYNVVVLQTAESFGQDYSRAMTLYRDACEVLRNWCNLWDARNRADDFIARTYGPGKVAV